MTSAVGNGFSQMKETVTPFSENNNSNNNNNNNTPLDENIINEYISDRNSINKNENKLFSSNKSSWFSSPTSSKPTTTIKPKYYYYFIFYYYIIFFIK